MSKSTQRRSFEIESDLEFYCYLKSNLPAGYSIVSEPQTGYFSEWQFRYVLRRGNEPLKVYAGDFRTIEKGLLVREAARLLAEAGGEPC